MIRWRKIYQINEIAPDEAQEYRDMMMDTYERMKKQNVAEWEDFLITIEFGYFTEDYWNFHGVSLCKDG